MKVAVLQFYTFLDALIRKWNVTENEIVRKMADYLRGARSRWENECGRQLTTIELTSTSDTSNTPGPSEKYNTHTSSGVMIKHKADNAGHLSDNSISS